MIDLASLIGFGLALVACSWAASLLLGGAFFALAPRLREQGPVAERRAAAAALVLPAVIGLAVVVALVARSLAIPILGLDDHCPAHVHHLHLCLFHGAGWTAHAGAVVSVTMVGTYVAVCLAQIAASHLAAARSLRQLRQSARAVSRDDTELWLAPSSRVFLFVAGLVRPRIYVSTEAWETLADDEREAALSHERSHARQRDPFWRSIYGLCALLGAPLLSRRLLGVWASATERQCDAQAAADVGSPDPVARALVALARRSLSAGAPTPALSFVPSRDELTRRVNALLASGGLTPKPLARGRTGLVVAGVLATALLLADPLHHALETVLGVL